MNATKGKATPGPWRISDSPKHPDSGGYAEVVAGDIGVYIADVIPVQSPHQYGPDAADIEFELDDETSMANARLIAAAPELLAILKRLDDWVKSRPTELEFMGGSDIIEEVQAALAKACPDES